MRSTAATLRVALGVAITNLVFFPTLAVWSLTAFALSPLVVGVALAAGLSRGQATRWFIWFYGRGWLVLVWPFLRLTREGFSPGVGAAPCVLVVNHLSFFDTFFMGALPFYDVTFAVRSWPFKMLWFTPFMRLAGYLDVEGAGGEETLEACRRILGLGGRVLFFPEGHRSRDGRLQRFHTGAFRIAAEAGVPVVPLCLTGTGRFLPPGRWWVAPSRVRLRALAPVLAGEFAGPLPHRKLRDRVREQMARTLVEMDRLDGRTPPEEGTP